jgi:hypothetical protein
VARGARIPVRTQAERDALTAFVGLEVFRLDTGAVELCTATGPAVWTPTRPSLTSTVPTSFAAAFAGSGTTPLRVYKDQNGLCSLSGKCVTTTTIASFAGTWFTLPTGFRPTVPVTWIAHLQSGGMLDYTIGTDGVVTGLGMFVGSYPIPSGYGMDFNHTFSTV